MMQLKKRMMTHYSVMATHQKLEIDKFDDFSCDINYNSRTDVFGDVISLLINQCDPKRPPAAQRKQGKRAYIYIYKYTLIGF